MHTPRGLTGTREAFDTELVEVQERINFLQSELIVELLPRDPDDELGVVSAHNHKYTHIRILLLPRNPVDELAAVYAHTDTHTHTSMYMYIYIYINIYIYM